jgi:small ligand-binding sensory domain FIST
LQFGLVPAKFDSDVMAAFLDDVADGKIRAGEIGPLASPSAKQGPAASHQRAC